MFGRSAPAAARVVKKTRAGRVKRRFMGIRRLRFSPRESGPVKRAQQCSFPPSLLSCFIRHLGERTATVGKALCGVPYGNYTLEIDDRIESPSANFLTMDCWTFYEISLAFARMIKNPESACLREALLHYIELERYRDRKCDGNYLSQGFPSISSRSVATWASSCFGPRRRRRLRE